MFAAPTPANTPQITACAAMPPEDYVVIDVTETGRAEQSVPTLTLAPSVDKAFRAKLLAFRQRNTTPGMPDSGNAEMLPLALEVLKSRLNSVWADTP